VDHLDETAWESLSRLLFALSPAPSVSGPARPS
jgi:hypothetical protein